MDWFEVIDENKEYIIPIMGNYAAACQKFIIEDNQYSKLKNGYIGQIVFEFPNPSGIILTILKVVGFEDYYCCIAKSALKPIDRTELNPFIVWKYLPTEVSKKEVTIKGKLVSFDSQNVELEKNKVSQEINKDSSFSITVNTEDGINKFNLNVSANGYKDKNYSIEIRNSKKLNQEIKRNLFESQIFDFYKEENLKKLLNKSIRQGYFLAPKEFEAFIYVDAQNLVKGEYRTYLSKIGNYIKKLGCKFVIEKEESTNTELKFFHNVIINSKRYKIFDGDLSSENRFQKYVESLVKITNDILSSNKKQERAKLITTIDNVMVSILTPENYNKLKKICKELENEFVK